MTPRTTARTTARTAAPLKKSPVRIAALAVGAVFLLVGVLGFVPFLVTDFEEFAVRGAESEAFLFGVFQVSGLHNLVHAAFGLAGIALSRTAPTSRMFLLVGGVLYLLLWVYGLFVDFYAPTNFLPVNVADNVLHFLLGVGMLAAGVLLPRFGEWPTEVVAADEDAAPQ